LGEQALVQGGKMAGTGKIQVQRQLGYALLRITFEPPARLGQAQRQEIL
jgi:hypothetical protein